VYHSIINGLIITLEARSCQYNQQFTAQEEGHKKKTKDLKESVEFLEACLIGYMDTFSIPPEGYIKNGQLPHFTIPVGGGLSNPAKWIKQLDDGCVTGYSKEDGPNDLPHISKVYAMPKYTADPAEPLPHWVHKTIQGPATSYLVFLDAVKNMGDWGLQADVMHYRDIDE